MARPLNRGVSGHLVGAQLVLVYFTNQFETRVVPCQGRGYFVVPFICFPSRCTVWLEYRQVYYGKPSGTSSGIKKRVGKLWLGQP